MRNSLARIIYFVFVSGLLIAAPAARGQVNTPGGATNPAAQAIPRFEDANCAVLLPPGENARCGYLIVLESRKAGTGHTIRLPIIILKSDNPHPAPDPILRTFGGPGASSMNLVNSRRASPWLKNRDLIIYEQRGTKYAQPALDCPEVKDANFASITQNLAAPAARANELRAAKICYDRLKKQGIDLSAYNTAESAADIEDLRRVLKLDRLNLWGLSYSSHLMLEVMRDYPAGIRSVVLESSLPPEINYDEVGVDAILHAFNVVFANCRADAACAKAYPNLENEFYETFARLNKTPVFAPAKDRQIGAALNLKLDGNDFVDWLVDYLLSDQASSIADVPLVIHNIYQGNYQAFAKYAGAKTSISATGLGMRYSFWCAEEIPFEDRRKIKAQSSYPKLQGFEVMSLPDICRVWKVTPAARIENQPVASDIPAMVITAEYDAYTPPAWGQAIAKRLSRSFLFEVPWAGHGPAFSTPCLGGMIADFFDRPQTAPAAECLAQVRQNFKFTIK